jgi:hypothetical protein
MPCLPPDPRARVFEGLELEAIGGEADAAAVVEEAGPIGRDEMRHGVSLPHVAMQPETAVHRVDHPIATLLELAVRHFVTPDRITGFGAVITRRDRRPH